jgi:hypothetical protein
LDRSGEVRVVGETEIVGEASEVRCTLADLVERQADPQPVPVLAHGAPDELDEHAAQMMR